MRVAYDFNIPEIILRTEYKRLTLSCHDDGHVSGKIHSNPIYDPLQGSFRDGPRIIPWTQLEVSTAPIRSTKFIVTVVQLLDGTS